MTRPVILMLGHGYSAAALAASLAGWRRMGTTRTPEGAAAMRTAGVDPIDWADPGAVDAAIAEASHLLVSAPPGAAGDPVLARHGTALVAAPAGRSPRPSRPAGRHRPRSSRDSPPSPPAPGNARSRWRLEAEAAWLASGLPVNAFRLAGIYGPGRSAFDRLREGRAQRVVKAGQVFSRIHVDDLAAVLRTSMERVAPGRVYNVADDEPAPPQDVIAYAAGLLGMAVPPEVAFEAAALSPMARSFYAESKRVSNWRIKEELGVTLACPSYREGLRAILAAGG